MTTTLSPGETRARSTARKATASGSTSAAVSHGMRRGQTVHDRLRGHDEDVGVAAPQPRPVGAGDVDAVLSADGVTPGRVVAVAEVVAPVRHWTHTPQGSSISTTIRSPTAETPIRCRSRADRGNLSDELMSGHERERIADVPVEQVQIGRADADPLDSHEQFACFGSRNGPLAEFDHTLAGEHHLS